MNLENYPDLTCFDIVVDRCFERKIVQQVIVVCCSMENERKISTFREKRSVNVSRTFLYCRRSLFHQSRDYLMPIIKCK